MRSVYESAERISNCRILTRQEERELIRAGQAGDQAARDAVLFGTWRFFKRSAWKFSLKRGGDPNEYLQIAYQKMVELFPLFDLSRNFRFLSYAYLAVKREWVIHLNRYQISTISLPVPAGDLLPATLRLREVVARGRRSLEQSTVRELTKPKPAPCSEFLLSREPDVLDSMMQQETQERLWKAFLVHYSELTRSQQIVVDGLLDGLTQAEIADKLGCSRQWIGVVYQKLIQNARLALKRHDPVVVADYLNF